MALSPFAARYGEAAGGGDPRFVSDIHPADEMFSFCRNSLYGSEDAGAVLYFSTGRLIADSLTGALAWRFPGGAPASILDFAAGFGRVTRFLALRFDPATITVSELEPEPLRFQERAFGVRGILSAPDAADFDSGRVFDAVAVSSFLSHLAEDRFVPWLARLWSCVAPGGVLGFSTHGPALHTEAADWSRGIVFRSSSETDRLDPAAYGTSWVTPDFVSAAARTACVGGALHAIPFGLDGRQDMYLIAKEPGLPPAPPALPAVPRGDLDRSDISDRSRIVCEGHLDSAGEADVVFLVRHEERARVGVAPGSRPRPWRFDIPREGIAPDDVLRVEARSPQGRVRILTMGTLRPYL